MSDFFGNLLDRAHGRAPVIERRVPSRFENSRDDSRVAIAETMAEGAPAEPVAAATVAQPISIVAPTPRIHDRVIERERVHDIRHESHHERLVEQHQVERRTERIEAAPAAAGIAPRVLPAPLESLRETRIETRIAPAEPVKSPPPQIVERHTISPQPRTPKPQIQPVPAQRRAARIEAQSSAKPAAPTIHVTIGRVEIRGQSASTPPKSARSRGPRLNLDDYLNSRAGGSR